MSWWELLPVGLTAMGLLGLHSGLWLLVEARAGSLASRRVRRSGSSLLPAAGAVIIMVAGVAVLSLLVVEGRASFIDESIASLIEPVRTPHLIRMFSWITLLGNTETLIGIFLIAMLLLGLRGQRASAATVAAVWIGAYATTWTLKYIVDRPRPEFVFDVIAYSPSFPSAHATGSISLFGILAYVAVRNEVRLRWRFEVIFWAAVLIVLVSFSRIYVSVHHGSDVMAGLMVGGSWLLSGILVAERLQWSEDRHAHRA